MSVEEWISSAAQLDVDGLEFYWGFTPTDAAELARIRQHAESRGLTIPMMCYSSDFTHTSERKRSEAVADQIEALRVTAALGGKYCRVLSGQRRPEVGVDEGVRWVVAAITEALAAAEDLGVVLIFENHFKDGFWDYPEFAQAPEIYFDILDQIPASPYFGVNYDPSNALVAGACPVEFLTRVLPRVVTMHASDRRLRPGASLDSASEKYAYEDLIHGVIGTGIIPYDEIFSLLAERGFQGWISIENGNDPARGIEHLAASAAFLREKMLTYGLT